MAFNNPVDSQVGHELLAFICPIWWCPISFFFITLCLLLTSPEGSLEDTPLLLLASVPRAEPWLIGLVCPFLVSGA